MSTYLEQMTLAMRLLADRGAIFMGQAVAYPGTSMTKTFEGIAPDQLLELPVAEDMQLGMATGIALAGGLPVCVYPRWNFLLLATSQLVLHLDKLSAMSGGGFDPCVIVRTSVGAEGPLHPGHQHVGNYSDPYRAMLKHAHVVDLLWADEIVEQYARALDRGGPTILVERMELY